MANQVVETLIEAGKATAAPPLGPALGPTGVNIGQVVSEINKRTADMKGMQVPIKVVVDTSTKEFSIEVGTPPAAALIKKESSVEKGASNPLTEKVGDLLIQQVIKIAKIKEDDLLGKTLKSKVREVIGTCQSMGILVEGMTAQEALRSVAEGRFDEEIRLERTELTEEQKAKMEAERARLKTELERRRAEFEAKAKAIMSEMQGQEVRKIRAKMQEVGIPQPLIDELAPEAKAEGAAGGKK